MGIADHPPSTTGLKILLFHHENSQESLEFLCLIFFVFPESGLIIFRLVLMQAALDVICTTVRCNPVPLPAAFLDDVFPVVVHCAISSDDNAVMQVHIPFNVRDNFVLKTTHHCL